MSCYAITKVPLNMKATSDEIELALKRMGLTFTKEGTDYLLSNGAALLPSGLLSWQIGGNIAALDQRKFLQQLQASKAIRTAEREGYKVVKEETDRNGKVRLRLIG